MSQNCFCLHPVSKLAMKTFLFLLFTCFPHFSGVQISHILCLFVDVVVAVVVVVVVAIVLFYDWFFSSFRSSPCWRLQHSAGGLFKRKPPPGCERIRHHQDDDLHFWQRLGDSVIEGLFSPLFLLGDASCCFCRLRSGWDQKERDLDESKGDNHFYQGSKRYGSREFQPPKNLTFQELVVCWNIMILMK